MAEKNEIVNEEIDLQRLFWIIWAKKYWIIGTLVIASIIAVVYAISLPNVYASRTVIKPVNTGSDLLNDSLGGLRGLAGLSGVKLGSSSGSVFNDLNAIIRSDDFIADFVKKNNLEAPLVYGYDAIKNDETFKNNYVYYISKAVKDNLVFVQDDTTSFITLEFRNIDRFFAKRFMDLFLTELNNKNKEISLRSINQQIEGYQNEIARVHDISIKTSLSSMAAGLIQQRVLAQAQKYYNFTVVIPPNVPDEVAKVGPNRALICISIFIAAFIISLFTVFAIEWFKYLKKIKPEKSKILE